MNSVLYIASVLTVSTLVTWLTRAAPFIVFNKRELPQTIKYLGAALPPAIMVILVCYCLRNTDFSAAPYGFPELISCAVVVILHKLKNNMYLSIVAGTAVYMILFRINF